MRVLFAMLLVLHALIHLMGPAKAFRFADLPQLTQPISPTGAVVWLAATLLFLAAAAALFVWPRGWWAIGAAALLVSQAAIATSWTDAKFGSIVNAIVLAGVAIGFFAQGPWSLRARYDNDVAQGLTRATAQPTITEADIGRLPAPVQTYLRAAGVVGRPRVQNVMLRMHGRIRSDGHSPWMPFSAEQHNFFDRPARLFYLTATRAGIPILGLHRYQGPDATMLIKAAGLVPVARAAGAEMTRAETVTLFNDMCLFAPATLIDPAIAWEAIDARTVRATFMNAGYTIRAELVFNDAGDLVDFRSDDRLQTSPAGDGMRAMRWSTPVGGYGVFEGVRLVARGQALWHDPSGAYAYIEIEVDEVRFNVR